MTELRTLHMRKTQVIYRLLVSSTLHLVTDYLMFIEVVNLLEAKVEPNIHTLDFLFYLIFTF